MTSAMPEQTETDVKNAAFWNELCGSGLARSLGITESTPESLRKFDEAYMAMYPYLSRYVTEEELAGKRVLEISSRRADASTMALTSPIAPSRSCATG
jgi:hypothetical protein